ncbi:MAG: reverse transcriptase/maturase family protein [bacterium]|nr:reverse transcriptase/maturase family protein [bacterium]
MIHFYDSIISLENLCKAWEEFVRGKKKKADVMEFSLNLSDNIFRLYLDLKNRTYQHGGYEAFSINDPKPRSIHKATVRDRLLHHAVYRILYPYFDKKFIFDSYSCRNGKGTHRALDRFRDFGRKVSKNNTRTCWVLKCDVRKFFASVDQGILLTIMTRHICDGDTLRLISRIVGSFTSGAENKGLPLGNLTSQLLVNIYMNEFDQWVKHILKQKHYLRYTDDFVFMSDNKKELEKLLPKVQDWLEENLKLSLHPDKVFIKTFASGVDWLGWTHFPGHRVLRTATKKRMFRNLRKEPLKEESVISYLGLLKHGNAYKLKRLIPARSENFNKV